MKTPRTDSSPSTRVRTATRLPLSKVLPARNLYTIDEAREWLGGISRNSIYALFGSGKLASVQIGRRRFVPPAALEAFVAEATSADPPQARRSHEGGVNFATLRLSRQTED